MKKYIFDRNEFNWSEEFYKLIKDKFNLPDWTRTNKSEIRSLLPYPFGYWKKMFPVGIEPTS